MNRSRLVVLAVVLTLLALAPAAGSAPAGVPPVPLLVSYQGHVLVGGVPYGTPDAQIGYFKFAVVDLAGTPAYWSNDGTSSSGEEPDGAVSLPVTNGLFSVLLGDTSLEGMKVALTPDAFAGPDRLLRVWFSPSEGGPFTQLGDRRFTATPYAFVAQEAASAITLGGLPPSAFLPAPQNVVIVAVSGGDYSTISAALADITDAGSNNRYLVWVAPGEYAETVTMKDFVDIAGAGEQLTYISAPGTSTGTNGTVRCANNAELRDLTVLSTGNNYAIAIRCDAASPRLTRVTATASRGALGNYGVYNTTRAAPAMTRVTATASGGLSNHGVRNVNASPVMNDVTATAWGYAVGDSNVYNNGVSNTEGSSPDMNHVTAKATGHCAGGDINVYNYGVHNSESSPTMNHVTAEASGDNGGSASVVNNRGIDVIEAPTPLAMHEVTAIASGLGSQNTGVWSYDTSLMIRGSTVRATDGTSNTGVSTYRSEGSGYIVEISNSVVEASTSTLSQYWDFTFRVAASQLAGGPISYWTTSFICVGVYDEVFAPLNSTCQ